MDAEKCLELIDQMRHHADLDHQREQLMVAAMLTGEEGHLFGRRVRMHLEWPDGRPWGMTEGELRQYGEEMKARVLAMANGNGKAH